MKLQVETIGDGYLCVSGLPHRNGKEHIKEIASLSLQLSSSLKTFKISYLPNEAVNIRVGVHTGWRALSILFMSIGKFECRTTICTEVKCFVTKVKRGILLQSVSLLYKSFYT